MFISGYKASKRSLIFLSKFRKHSMYLKDLTVFQKQIEGLGGKDNYVLDTENIVS